MATEKRLIDALPLMTNGWHLERTGGSNRLLVSMSLADVPTVDAVEVVHGEWIVCGDGEYVPFMCSACGKTTSWYHAQTANYCPNCGAKMDGDGNG